MSFVLMHTPLLPLHLPIAAITEGQANKMAAFGIGGILIFGLIALLLYFIPTFIAFIRDHQYKWPIFAINLLVGYTGLGYLVALVWSLFPARSGPTHVVVRDTSGNPYASNRPYLYRPQTRN